MTDEEIEKAKILYAKLGSVWKVGAIMGISGQRIHSKLYKLGLTKPIRVWTKEEQDLVIDLYKSGMVRGDGKLDALAKKINRTKNFICRYARTHGLTDPSRDVTEEFKLARSERHKEWHKNNEHPRGMAGKEHSDEVKKIIGLQSTKRFHDMTEEQLSNWVLKMLKTRHKNGNLHKPRTGCSWKQGWREIGGKRNYYRSRWEANYARYLQFLKDSGEIEDWEHEPETFWFEAIMRGTRSYLPDFKVTEKETSYFVEVKGWMDARSKTKLKRMKKYHPDVEVRLVDDKAYMKLSKAIGPYIKDWELDSRGR